METQVVREALDPAFQMRPTARAWPRILEGTVQPLKPDNTQSVVFDPPVRLQSGISFSAAHVTADTQNTHFLEPGELATVEVVRGKGALDFVIARAIETRAVSPSA